MSTVVGLDPYMTLKSANSSINSKLQSGTLPVTYQLLVPGHTKVGSYLIGDPAYPLTPHCMKEYETWNTNAQVVFNNMLRSARNPIECAFGRLKAWWGFLTRKIDLELDVVPAAIYACFVLHNICGQQVHYLDPQLVENQEYLLEHKQQEAKKSQTLYSQVHKHIQRIKTLEGHQKPGQRPEENFTQAYMVRTHQLLNLNSNSTGHSLDTYE